MALSIILFPAGAVGAEHYAFKQISSEQGLSANNVKCITRDRLGFMWFGTKNGLNRYDGSTIRRFDVFDTKLNRGNNNIGALYADENSNLWIGTDRGIYIYNPHDDSINHVGQRTSEGVVATNWVQRIVGDSKGNVWALLPDEGVYLYSGETVRHFSITRPETLKVIFPSDICVDHDGNVWVVTSGAGVFKYDTKAGRFIYVNPNGDVDIKNELICCVCVNDEGNLVMGSSEGHLYCYNTKTNAIEPVKYSKSGGIYLRYIECFEDEIWIGTHSGLWILNKTTGRETFLSENSADQFSLSDNTVYCIYRDADGGAWLGTMFGGVSYLPRRKFNFTNYGLNHNLSSRLVLGLANDINGNIWIGTENAGVNILDPKTSTIRPATCYNRSDQIVLMMTEYDGNVYTSFSRSGLYKTDSDGHTSKIFPLSDDQDANVYSYLIDSKGNEWVGQGFALFRRAKGDNEFVRIPTTNYDWIYYIMEASDGMIWIGTMGNGVWKYNPANGKFKSYVYDHAATNPTGLKSNSVNYILEDSNGNIWVSTDRGGLSKYNEETDNFTTYGLADGLPDDCVYSILEDNKGNLWFGTNKGLVRFTPANLCVQVFTTEDGLSGNQYNYKSAIRGADGRFYFGGINGVASFIPELYAFDPVPSVYITELHVMSDKHEVSSIVFEDNVKFNYNKSTFAVNVASPSYRHSGRLSMSYRLLPVNQEWIPMSGNQISFTNLAPGEYDLEVKVFNGTSSNVSVLKIEVLPPWWKSAWAYCIYAILIIVAALIWFVWYRNKKEQQLRSREEAFAINKEKELYRSKVTFFTEIAHEIRTPLSLIDLPLEAIEEIGVSNPNIKKYLKVSRQNTHRLLELTGQLLDFEKLDSNKLTLKNENVDVVSFIKNIAERFEPTFALTGKNFISEIDERQLTVSTDREALTKIVSNLLNNALKYGMHTIRLKLIQNDDTFVVKVYSDGAKIEYDERERIFSPFYQTSDSEREKNGVGIGLPLSRSLATLLGGSLSLDDNSDELNIFTLSLPKTAPLVEREATMDSEMENYMLKEESNQAKLRSDVYSVLLVEDNANILEFLAEQLRRLFVVETAANGKEALEKLSSRPFDIIVTDIMMPIMDGLELCRRVKEDINISHIPVVFITAKNDLDSKIKGLQYGAEAYVEKPFSIKYLRQLINSLLDNRRRERNSYSKNPFFSIDSMQMSKNDEAFMNKVQDVISQHVCEGEFSVDMLCDILAMSRSSLLRKIKTLFNMTPAELIRLIKFKKAAELIQSGEYRISDVCYMVGVGSPSYFSKQFYNQFGITPKDFEKQCRAKNSSLHQKKTTENITDDEE